MTLRARTLVLVGLTLLFLSGISVFLTRTIMSRGFEELESAMARSAGQRALYAVQQEQTRLSAITEDWGRWDETHLFVQGRDPAYVERNLSVSGVTPLNVDFMVFLDSPGRVVHSLVLTPAKDSVVAMPPVLLDAIRAAVAGGKLSPDDSPRAGILSYSGLVALVAAGIVTDSQRQTASAGILVVGRLMDDKWARITTENLIYPIRLIRNDSTHAARLTPAARNALAPNPANALVPLSEQQLAIYMRLTDLEGNSNLFLEVTVSRAAWQQGQASIQLLTAALFLVGLGVLVVVALMLEFGFIRPIRRLVNRIGALAETPDFSQRLPEAHGDEMSRLAQSINRMLAAIEDSTARLRQSEERQRTILDTVQTGILLIDAETQKILDVNPVAAHLIGASKHEIVHRACHEFICAAEAGNCPAKIHGTSTDNSEQILLRSDGSSIPILKNVTPIQLEGRGCYLESFIDLRRQKQTEEERRYLELRLARAQKMESLHVMAGSIAHNFNNLLQAVIGNIELITPEVPEGTHVRDCLDAANIAASRAADLSTLMLTYVGQGGRRPQPVNLNDICNNARAEMQRVASGISDLRIVLEANLPSLRGDPEQIAQALLNLVTNAAEATEKKQNGWVQIRTGHTFCSAEYLQQTYLYEDQPEGAYLFLEIADNGAGMTRETAARAFDPYFTTRFAGRGLGLSAVLGIVRAHKGAIMMYSEPGHGTRFKMLFPVPSSAGPSPAPPPAPSLWRGQGTILLVDDEVNVRAVGRAILEDIGFTVRVATDGGETLRILREIISEPDAPPLVSILLDLMLPGETGDKLLAPIRQIAPDVPIVLASGYPEDELLERFADAGFAAFIQKPYEHASLIERLRAILEK